MTDATVFRLDTADLAIEAGWSIESVRRIDEFVKEGVTVMVQYGHGDEIASLTRSWEARAGEVYGGDSPGKAERLRIWLGVRAISGRKSFANGLPDIPFTQDYRGWCWALESFA